MNGSQVAAALDERFNAFLDSVADDPAKVIRPAAAFIGTALAVGWFLRATMQVRGTSSIGKERPQDMFVREYCQAQRVAQLSAGLICEACGLPGVDVNAERSTDSNRCTCPALTTEVGGHLPGCQALRS